MLSALGNRELPIPEHIDIYHLQREMAPSDKTAVQCVMEVDAERVRLEREAEQLSTMSSDGTSRTGVGLRYNHTAHPVHLRHTTHTLCDVECCDCYTRYR